MSSVDPITRSVVQHRLSSIVAEMGEAMLEHTGAAARRLQMSAESTADADKRAMAKAAEEAQAIKPAKAVAKKAVKKRS